MTEPRDKDIRTALILAGHREPKCLYCLHFQIENSTAFVDEYRGSVHCPIIGKLAHEDDICTDYEAESEEFDRIFGDLTEDMFDG